MSNIEDSSMENFGFAFNDRDFADRVLHIHIIPDEVSLSSNLKKNTFLNSLLHSDDSDCRVGVKVISLHLSSPILAAKSPFFYKLLKNGMIESQQREATLRIYSSEEAALMDLLKFMYFNTLSATTCSDLVDVLMAADKFGVTSCTKHCMQMLLKTPMSLESALLYLELPVTSLVVQPLIEASKQYLVARYRDFHKSEEEAMELPLCAIEIVLGSEGLQVTSEDYVFEFILKWGRAHYPKLKERRRVLSKCLAQLVCFPSMSCSKLRKALACADFNHEHVSNLVVQALFLKAEDPNRQYTKTSSLGRLYTNRLLKVVQLEFPSPRCIIYFDLTKEECRTLFPSNEICSEDSCVGGRRFYLGARCDKEQDSSSKHFGLFVHMIEGSKTCMCTVDLQFAVMAKPSMEYEMQAKGNICVSKGKGFGWGDLFGISWTEFMSDDSEYFIDGILHLRAQLTIINSQP